MYGGKCVNSKSFPQASWQTRIVDDRIAKL